MPKRRFTDEGGDGIGAFAFNQRFQFGRTIGHESGLGLVKVVAAAVVAGGIVLLAMA